MKKTWMLSKDAEFLEICEILEKNGWMQEDVRLKIAEGFEKWNDKGTSAKKVCLVLDTFDVSNKEDEQLVSAILMQMIRNNTNSWRMAIKESIWAANEFVMNNLISIDWRMIFYIAPKLANDESFIFNYLRTKANIGRSNTIYRVIGPELKCDEEFLIKFIRLIVLKYTEKGLFVKLKDRDFTQIIKNMKITRFVSRSQTIKRELCLLGLRNDENAQELKMIAKAATEMNQQARNLVKSPENIKEGQKDNYVLMLNVLKLNPDLYVLASNRLKCSESFQKEAIKCGVAKEIVVGEYKKIQEHRRNAIREKNQELHEQEKERKKKLYGAGSKYYALVDNFLNTHDSISTFCEENNLQESEFKQIFDSVTDENPEIRKRREERFVYFKNNWGQRVKSVCDQILQDESYLYAFAKKKQKFVTPIDLVKTSSDKRRMSENILRAIVSGKLGMNDYVRLFSCENDYEKMMHEVNKFFCFVEKVCPELTGKANLVYQARREMYKFRMYAPKFVRKEFVNTKVGYDSEDGRVDYILVTPERLEEVISYLKNHDEYICRKTVNRAITMFCNSTWKT